MTTTEKPEHTLQRHQLASRRPKTGDFVRIDDNTELKQIAEWEASVPDGKPLRDTLERSYELDARRQNSGTYEGRCTLADTESNGRFMAMFWGDAPQVVWEQGRKGAVITEPLVLTEETKEAEFWMPRHGQTDQDPDLHSIKARVWAVKR